MPSVAFDIGTYTIKAVHAKPGKKPQISRTVEVFNEIGMSVPSDEANIEKMAALVDSIFTDHKLPRKDVRLSLPEQVVSTKVIGIPPLSDAELASAIGWQAEQHIPIPLEELSLEYQVLYRPPRGDKQHKMQVLLVGSRKKVIENYLEAFLGAGIEPTILETQAISNIRSLGFEADDPTTLVVSIGSTAMDIIAVTAGQLRFVFSHLNGGQLLSKTIEQTIGLDSKQAEQYKRTYGLEEQQFEGKIRQVLLSPIKIFTDEILKAMQFHQNQNPNDPVQRILLMGGSAQLPGLIQHMTAELNVEVLLAAPFASASGEIPQTNHPAFGVCMGLIAKEI